MRGKSGERLGQLCQTLVVSGESLAHGARGDAGVGHLVPLGLLGRDHQAQRFVLLSGGGGSSVGFRVPVVIHVKVPDKPGSDDVRCDRGGVVGELPLLVVGGRGDCGGRRARG